MFWGLGLSCLVDAPRGSRGERGADTVTERGAEGGGRRARDLVGIGKELLTRGKIHTIEASMCHWGGHGTEVHLARARLVHERN